MLIPPNLPAVVAAYPAHRLRGHGLTVTTGTAWPLRMPVLRRTYNLPGQVRPRPIAQRRFLNTHRSNLAAELTGG